MKKNILVTTDLSDNSKRAFNGAIELAKKLNGTIYLCYVVNDLDYLPSVSPIGGENIQSIVFQKELLDKEIQRKEEEFTNLVEDLSFNNIEAIIKKGSLIDGLNQAIEEFEIAFTITASNGESNLMEKIFGSNALEMMRNLNSPVIALSPGSEKLIFENIAYAVSSFFENEKFEKAILKLAKRFDSNVDFVHVEDGKYELYRKQEALLKAEVDYLNYKNLRLVMKDSEKPFDGIQDYIKHNKCDLLALVSHTDNIFEKILHTSVVNQALNKLSLPILCYNKNSKI